MAIWYGDAGSDNTTNSGGALTSSIQTTDSGIDTRWRIFRQSTNQYGAMDHDATQGSFSSTTPTTSNGDFSFGTISSQVQANQGYITPPITGTIPAGQWTFQLDITDNDIGGAVRFVGFLFKCSDETASSSGTLTATHIQEYSNSGLTTTTTPTTNSITAANSTQTASTSFYCDAVTLSSEHLFFQLWCQITSTGRTNFKVETDPTAFNDIGVALITPDPKRRIFVIS